MRRAAVLLLLVAIRPAAAVDVGTVVTAENVDTVAALLLPGEVDAVRRGLRIEVAAPRRVLWRRAYKEATEKNAGQTRLGPRGELLGYVAGLPFLDIDPKDPQVADKIIWNHACGPWRVDDARAWSF